MKKYSLAISLPLRRNLSQDIVLDELLADKRAVSYSRVTAQPETSPYPVETFLINYILTVA